MNNKDLLKALGQIEEEMVEAAEISGQKSGKKPRPYLLAGLGVAAACLLLGFLAIHSGLLRREKPPAPVPYSSEAKDTETAPPATEPAPQDAILYQADGVTVREASGVTGGGKSEQYELAYLTEEELFDSPLVMRARLVEVKSLEITQEYAFLTGSNKIHATLLSFEPISLLHGELPEEGLVKVFASSYAGTSLEGLNLAMRSAGKGREGIIMLHQMEDWSPEYMTALASYVPGDHQRFAIWEMPGGGLAYDQHTFSELDKSWTLDQAEAYVREVIGDCAKAPEDFWLEFSETFYGEEPGDDRSLYYDSRSGLYRSRDSSTEERFGTELLETRLDLEADVLSRMYRRLKRIQALPEMLSATDGAGSPGTKRIEIRWFAQGQAHHVLYAGHWYTDNNRDVVRLEKTGRDLRHFMGQSQAFHDWDRQMAVIKAERRREESQALLEMLEAALKEKYSPDGKPEYFRGAWITEGGYLEIWLDPCTKKHIQEIVQMLPENENTSFAEGRPEDRESLYYDVRMWLALGEKLAPLAPRGKLISEESFQKAPAEGHIHIAYRYGDGRQTARYGFRMDQEEESWEPFGSLRMRIQSPAGGGDIISEAVTRRLDLEYAWYLSVCRGFRPIREEDRQTAGEPIAWIYAESPLMGGPETVQVGESIFLLLEDGRLMHGTGRYPDKPMPGDPSVDAVTPRPALDEESLLHLLAIGLWYAENRDSIPQPDAASPEPGLRWR